MEDLLGLPVDVVTEGSLPPRLRQRVLAEAVPPVRGPEERLQDMLEAIAAIERYRHLGRDELERSELLQVWFLHHLRIVGEAARAMPEEVRRLAPDVPWRQLVGMRHVLVHGYFHIDTGLV